MITIDEQLLTDSDVKVRGDNLGTPDAAVKKAMQDYEARKQTLCEQIKARGGKISLNKKTSNLFRHRHAKQQQHLLEVKDFNHVLQVDLQNMCVHVEGMTTF